jgi:hypothetical protein
MGFWSTVAAPSNTRRAVAPHRPPADLCPCDFTDEERDCNLAPVSSFIVIPRVVLQT